MLVNEIYLGSGIGNQIWTSVVTRIIAEKLGYKYSIKGKELWKGKGWMPYFWGEEVVGGTGPDGGPPETLPEGINKSLPIANLWASINLFLAFSL